MTNQPNKKFDLEERLIEFTCMVIDIVEAFPNTRVGNHFASQLVRCGTSPALNYGEAQVAESRTDFIHKMKICLKELKESNVIFKVIKRRNLISDLTATNTAAIECQELISIFVKSIETARKNK